MSRKNKSKPGSNPPPAVAAGMGQEGQAEAALAASRFKEAIEHFKALLKRERRPAWLAGLAAAYAGRAEQLVAKDMRKEALALWRTRADACGVPLLAGPYVGWLLQSGEVAQVLVLLRGGTALAPEQQAEIQNQLAAAVLVAPDALLAGLPAESPLLRHRAAAQAALAALAQGDDAALAEALRAIPFRSPYRDLRSLLKAASLLRTDPEQARAALARVPDAGPFARLAAALRVAVLPADEWLAGLRQLDDAGRALVLDLAGCPESQRALVMEIAQADASKPLVLFDLALRHRRALPEAMVRALCLRVLPHAPQRLDSFHAAFGPLPRAERERIMALAGELKHDLDSAVRRWLQFVEQLRADPAAHRRAALVLRRLADNRRFHEDDDTPEGPALRWLEQSLALDPSDREAELRLLRGLREQGDLKRSRTRLDAARARFPDDPGVLLEAVETALAGGAFKKAIGLAKEVLKLDPINPRVRSVIGQAHLSHARKQIEARNPKAARRELDEARSWLRGTAELATLGLLRGLVAESPAEGDALLRQALAELGGPLVGAFHLAVEAERSRMAAQTVLARAGADLDATPDTAQLALLAHALNAARADDRAVRRALDALRPLLQRSAAGAPGSESEQALVCEALHRQAEPDLTRRFAMAALQRWPGQPTFVYFEIAARYQGEPWRMPVREQDRLEKAFEKARAQGDRRAASRLADLLDQSGGGFGRFEIDDEDAFPDGPGDGMRDALEIILAAGGEAQFLDMARRQLGKATFDQMRREIGGSNKQFVRALLELLSIAEHEPVVKPRPVITPPNAARKPWPAPANESQKGLFDD